MIECWVSDSHSYPSIACASSNASYVTTNISFPITPVIFCRRPLTQSLFLCISFRWVISNEGSAEAQRRLRDSTMMLSSGEAYFKSFSIRSTWVMSMRRQQYLLHPSWSIASLLPVLGYAIVSECYRSAPICNSLIDQLQVSLPKVPNNLSCKQRIVQRRRGAYLSAGEAADGNNHLQCI